MNILFLTLLHIDNLDEHGIYQDLLRELSRQGHQLCVVSPAERRTGQQTHVRSESGNTFLIVKTGNIQKTNLIEKGISTVLLEQQFIQAIRKYLSNVHFDLILYSTPPITLEKAVAYVKKRDRARTYLLLKDIFPQNAVDLGMLPKSGPMGILYRYFRAKEKRLYALSDAIGCMSQANVDYVLAHNPEVEASKVEVCPNSIEVIDKSIDAEERNRMRVKYGIPTDKTVFVYGGNLGKPQGIPFLIQCLTKARDLNDAFFLIIGDGTEYEKLRSYTHSSAQKNLKLLRRLPKEDYDHLVAACDVGMVFLDHRFTIPNFPSRILSYMQAKLPILAVTDPNTDIGKIITGGGYGLWSESDDEERVISKITSMNDAKNLHNQGMRGFRYLKECFSVQSAAKTIIKRN